MYRSLLRMDLLQVTAGIKITIFAALTASLAIAPTKSGIAQSRFDQAGSRDRAMTPLLGASGQSSGWQGSSWLSANLAQPQDWQLGVSVENRDTGVLVRSVAPNSAGARARLEPNDLIIAVGGYQVGMIDGRLFDLGEELKKRADASGIVSILVQDHNSGQISSVRLQLDASTTTLSGEVVYRERFALPSDAIITVQIEDVTRPYIVVRGGQISMRSNGTSTMPFEIAYDANYVFPEDLYQIRAYVTSGGRTILETAPQRVITQGNPSKVRLNLAPIATQVATNPGSSVVTAGYPNYNSLDDQIIKVYQNYLGRNPTVGELAALRFSPNIQNRLSTLPIEMMAAQEYYDASGNNNQVWLQKVFTTIVGKPPTAAEFDQWNRRLAELRNSRTELLRQLSLVAPPRQL